MRQGRFPPWGLLGKAFEMAYGQALKVTYKFLTRNQTLHIKKVIVIPKQT